MINKVQIKYLKKLRKSVVELTEKEYNTFKVFSLAQICKHDTATTVEIKFNLLDALNAKIGSNTEQDIEERILYKIKDLNKFKIDESDIISDEINNFEVDIKTANKIVDDIIDDIICESKE